MITAKDFIRLPYTPDLTAGGIAYACRSLPHTYNRMGGSDAKRMRRIVGGVAVELAFRRYLGENEIPFDVQGATPFTDPDKYDVSLGGRRCDIKSFLLTHRAQIGEVRRDPGKLLGAQALIPSEQFVNENQRESDLYIFAFLTGLYADSQIEMKKALEAGELLHLVHTMPKSWAKPEHWQPLGELALKSECENPLMVELGGQDANRAFRSERFQLMPRRRVARQTSLHTLAYVHVDQMPGERVGIHAAKKGEVYLIAPHDWRNIRLYGMQIILAGYLTRALFRKRAREIPTGSRVYQYRETKTKNLGVPVRELMPLRELFAQVKKWNLEKKDG